VTMVGLIVSPELMKISCVLVIDTLFAGLGESEPIGL